MVCPKKTLLTVRPDIIVVRLNVLFSMIYLHRFVPDDFGRGITVLVLKYKVGDVSSVHITGCNCYRPVTTSPVIWKLFHFLFTV